MSECRSCSSPVPNGVTICPVCVYARIDQDTEGLEAEDDMEQARRRAGIIIGLMGRL